MVNPNGCAHCGLLQRSHGQRYDGLHPSGDHGYKEPTNELRLQRMRERREWRLTMISR